MKSSTPALPHLHDRMAGLAADERYDEAGWRRDRLAALVDAAQRVPVIATVRPEHGAILHATYGFPGSERDLRAGPLVCAGALSAAAARIKLMACLGAGLGRDGIAEAFAPDDA